MGGTKNASQVTAYKYTVTAYTVTAYTVTVYTVTAYSVTAYTVNKESEIQFQKGPTSADARPASITGAWDLTGVILAIL